MQCSTGVIITTHCAYCARDYRVVVLARGRDGPDEFRKPIRQGLRGPRYVHRGRGLSIPLIIEPLQNPCLEWGKTTISDYVSDALTGLTDIG